MKKIFITTVTIILAAIGMKAAAINNEQPFVFVESGIEIALFKDGQFDFNVIRPTSNVGVNINTRFLDFSFNSGHNYDTYVQYDDYGAVVQIENTTIDYDYYGRVYRIGNIHLDYNHNGLVSRIGNMRVGYNHYGSAVHVNGIINNYNVNYASYSPQCSVYRRPVANRVVIHNTPYRRNYTPVRYNYITYRKNYRRNNYSSRVYNYKRPGVVVRNNRNVIANRSYNKKTVNRPVARKIVTKRPIKQNVRVSNRTVVKNTPRVNNSRSYTPRTSNSRKTNAKVATKARTQNKQYKTVRTGASRTKTVVANGNNKTYRRR